MERIKAASPVVRIGAVVGIGLILTCCCLAVIVANAPDTETADRPTSTARPASADVPATDEATEVPGGFTGPTSAPTSDLEFPLIPGMSLIDFTFNLEDRGSTCTDTAVLNNRYSTSCTDDSTPTVLLTALATGPDAERVDYLSATVTQTITPSDEIAAVFLGFVATMPYDGAAPELAKAWVEATLPLVGDGSTPQSKRFGSVEFTLSGDPANRTLEMEGIDAASIDAPTPTSAPVLLVPNATSTDSAALIESSPTVESTIQPTAVLPMCDCSHDAYKCDNFPTPGEVSAQQCFDYCMDQGAGDIHRLDGDNDGYACEG